MDSAQVQASGVKWMFELELFQDAERSKAMLNTLKMNILTQSSRIRDCEILIFKEKRQMLVLLDISWFSKRFLKKRIFPDVYEVLTQLLPTFKFRVTADPEVMKRAVLILENALKGGNDEVPGDVNSASVQSVQPTSVSGTPDQSGGSPSVDNGGTKNPQASPQEQPEAGPGIRSESVPGDSKE